MWSICLWISGRSESALGLETDSINIDAAGLDSTRGIKTLGALLLNKLNERIEWFLGRDFQLGQWYLHPLVEATDINEAISALVSVWRGRIWPQLEESFALRPEQLAAILQTNDVEGDAFSVSSPPPESLRDLGAMATPRFDDSAPSVEIARSLVRLAARLSENH